ncbi:PREDICTED: taste receptor type 2 member 1-like [Chinchilla lanigera]|uniref:taste receptor type 2 member 1-like n=1 Tax=Chinchilla lanigera TaxID=34839 RepID=UPI00069684D8|nr:PREDICTED: taste receptor type 2 member 1-like [Chinchilla lanigera]
MLKHHLIIHFLIAVTQFLTGVFINGFIMVVNVVDFIRQRKMPPLDLLISCLVTSRICLHLHILLVHLVLLSFMNESTFAEYYITFLFVNDWGLWLATWLGVSYCTKIATIPQSLFFWLKMRISKLVPWLMLGSTLYAIFVYFNSYYTATNYLLIALLLLIFSLERHAQQMRSIAMGTQDPCRGDIIRAMLSILSFLILYFSYYTVGFLNIFQILQFGSYLLVFCTLVAGTYPSIHSVILILGNPKLKQNAKKFLLLAQCSW